MDAYIFLFFHCFKIAEKHKGTKANFNVFLSSRHNTICPERSQRVYIVLKSYDNNLKKVNALKSTIS